MLISFDTRKDNIYILCFIILHLFEIIIDETMDNNYILEYDKVLDTISPIFLIIFFYIEKKLSKKKKKIKKKRTPFKNLFNEYNKKSKNLKNTLLIICSICFYIIYKYTYDNLINSEEEIKMYLIIISLFIISRFFEKTFYSHHKISIIINFILTCYIFYENIENLKINIFYIIILSYSFAFYLSLIKYINTNYFTNIYFLRSIHSVFEFLYRFIRDKNFLSQNYHIYIIFIFIEKIIHVFLETIIILKLGTIQSVISESIARFIPMIYFKLFEDIKQYNMISFGISLISSLIYLEIIQLNFCGLNINTTKEIVERSILKNSTFDTVYINSDSSESKEIEDVLIHKEKIINITS